ncbi:MAG: GNAT family N-acetyltransferase [Candidatus Kerfeldbacteria bacterium]
MNTTKVKISTDNLLIRSTSLEDKNDIFREFTDEITTHMFPKPAETIDETIDFITSSIKENREGSNFQVTVVKKDTNEFLGCGGLHNTETRTPEFGIWLKKSAQGSGFGKEAIVALKEWADENLEFDYLLYPVAEDNVPSRKIPESLGGVMMREYDEVNMSGMEQHIMEYRIYPQARKR